MAESETSRKRMRESEGVEKEEAKRSCSYHKILSLLESDEEEPTQDLSFFISTLQQELSSDPSSEPPSELADPNPPSSSSPSSLLHNITSSSSSSSSPPLCKEEEDETTIRHLLEASDDELGIPTVENDQVLEEDFGKASFYDGFWEMEDEAANYYTLLQSELFM